MSYNPYGGEQGEYGNQTYPLDELIRYAVDGMLYNLHTWIPGRIESINSNGSVNVQPLLQKKYINSETPVTPPILQNVPVEHPRGTNWWVKLPIAVGDYGRVVFCERSIDKWMVSGGIVDPQDTRKHDMADGVFVPGLYPFSQKLTGNATDMVLHNATSEIVVQNDGKFKIKNDTQELLSILHNLINTLINANVVTLIGPQPFVPTTITELQTELTNLDTLKGS